MLANLFKVIKKFKDWHSYSVVYVQLVFQGSEYLRHLAGEVILTSAA